MHPTFVQSVVSDESRAEELNRCEETHWWYVGLRDFLTRLLSSPRFSVPRGGAVLDVGCGAGANLRLLAQLLQPTYLGGFDLNEHCLAAARLKCPSVDLYRGDLRRPEFHCAQYDLITCCDVLCAIGLKQCHDGLSQVAAHLAPQGRLLLHLPAYPWLYGEHDIAVGNLERYRANVVLRALARADLVPVWTTYRMCFAFPAVVAARLMRRSRTNGEPPPHPQSDLNRSRRGGSWWRALVALENAAACRGLRWPFGASLVILARRASSGA